jgi:hypothetical protein
MFRVKKYEEQDKQLWNFFVQTAKNGTFLFHRDFMDYHAHRFVDHSLLIFLDNKLLGVFVANQNENKIYAHAGLTYGGLIIQNELYTTFYFKIFRAVLNYYNENNFDEIYIKNIPAIFVKQPADEIDYLAFICEANLYRRDLHSTINYLNDYRVSKSVLRDFKSVQNKFSFKESLDFDIFWNTLLVPNLQEVHQSLPVHSLNEIRYLKQNFSNQIKLFGCYLDQKLIGGVVIFETDTVAHCQYISGTKMFNKLHGLCFLLQNVIAYYENKKAYFNFGISNVNYGKNINEGLLLWKEKFGARAVSQSFYCFKTNSATKIDSILV